MKYPAEIKAIADEIRVSRGTFYNWLKKGDDDVGKLIKRIEAADHKAKTGGGKSGHTASAAGRELAPAVSMGELEREIREGLARVVWEMRGLVSLMENASDVVEAPLHMAELDAKLSRCRAIYHRLEAPCLEWKAQRARSGTSAPQLALPPGTAAQPLDLFLDGPEHGLSP